MAPTPQRVPDPLEELRTQLRGELITSDQPGYEEARGVFFTGIDRRPLAVARVAGAEDAARAVIAARDAGLELAVRSGGHSRAGYGTTDGGLVIDLSGLKALEIDAESQTASVGTGITAGEYTAATGERGFVTGLGDTGSVGIGGITLAGGIGFLVRRNGLTADDLLAAEIVTAGGEVLEASEASEPDLFWAIRGGGGNFGIATRFKLRLHEISEIVGGMLILPATPEVIVGFLEAADAAPEELSTIANVMLAPPLPFVPAEAHGKPIVIGLMAYAGPIERGDAVISPFRALATPYADTVRPIRYPELYAAEGPAPAYASGANFFADSLPRSGAEAILEHLPQSTAMMKAVQIRVLGGALARVPDGATAFAHRTRRLFVNVAAMYADPAGSEAHDEWVARLVDSLGGRESGGYVGFLGAEDQATVRAAYPGATWDRLREVKRRYDPGNVFRLNHNIPPAQ